MFQFRNFTTFAAVIGAILAKIRDEKGLTQADVATALGLTTSTWSRIEKGESTLSAEQLWQAANRLGVSPGSILDVVTDAVSHLPASGIEVKTDKEIKSEKDTRSDDDQKKQGGAWRTSTVAGAVAVGLIPIAGPILGAAIGALTNGVLKNIKDTHE